MLNTKSKNGLVQPTTAAEFAAEVPMLKMFFPCNEGTGGITDLVSGAVLKSSTDSEVWSQDSNGIWGINHEGLDTVVGDLPFFHDTLYDTLYFIVLQLNYTAFEFSLGDDAGNNFVRMSNNATTGREMKYREDGQEAIGAAADIAADLPTSGGSIFIFRDSRVGGQSLRIYTGTCTEDTHVVNEAYGLSGLLLGTASPMANLVQQSYAGTSQGNVRMSGIGAFQVKQDAADVYTELDDWKLGLAWMTHQWRNNNEKKIYPHWMKRPVIFPAP